VVAVLMMKIFEMGFISARAPLVDADDSTPSQ
jgi:hypothetical protein